MSGGIGESKPRPVLSREGHERIRMRAEIRDLMELGLTKDEALERILAPYTDNDADAASDADEPAPPSGLDPDEVADIALGRKRPAPPPAVAEVLESLKRRNR